jgi:pyruvate formate-lyase activating enzyme-like uncharacterized protein
MEFHAAKSIIQQMADCNVTGISFTAGEPFIFLNDISNLIGLCSKNSIYSRVVTNGFWAKTQNQSDNIVSGLLQSGLSQLRISFSRWHQNMALIILSLLLPIFQKKMTGMNSFFGTTT